MIKTKVYLAARYSRREELCRYREELTALGYVVQARWLNGKDLETGKLENAWYECSNSDCDYRCGIDSPYTAAPTPARGDDKAPQQPPLVGYQARP